MSTGELQAENAQLREWLLHIVQREIRPGHWINEDIEEAVYKTLSVAPCYYEVEFGDEHENNGVFPIAELVEWEERSTTPPTKCLVCKFCASAYGETEEA